MDNQHCETCRFWKRSNTGVLKFIGTCQRFPPQRDSAHFSKLRKCLKTKAEKSDVNFLIFHGFLASTDPKTSETHWCGEYQPTPPTPENPVVVTSTLDMNQP